MKNPWIAAAQFIGIGWYTGLCIAGGFFGGRWVGQQLGQSEVFFGLLGMATGVVVAVYGMYVGYTVVRQKVNKGNDEEEN
ncbi:MAG: AtpZ/AtpI family protein [Dehalococcoidia bacterium]